MVGVDWNVCHHLSSLVLCNRDGSEHEGLARADLRRLQRISGLNIHYMPCSLNSRF